MTTVTGETTNVNEKLEVTNTTAVVNEPINRPPSLVETKVLMDTITPEPTQTNPFIAGDVPEVKKTVIGKPLKTDADITRGLAKAALLQTIPTIVLLVIFAAIPILQLYIGSHYTGQCPVSPRIPQYLVVAGAVGLVCIAILIVQNILMIVFVKKMVTESSSIENSAFVGACGMCCTAGVLFCLTLFLIVWFIVGCFWVFGVWYDVQYKYPKKTSYCHPILYRFAFWLLLISILSYAFSCIRSCFQTRQQQGLQTRGGLRTQTA